MIDDTLYRLIMTVLISFYFILIGRKLQKLDEDRMKECEFYFRIFKWNETQITVSEILKVIGINPIIGHKSGRLNNTHWMLFVKGASYIGDDKK